MVAPAGQCAFPEPFLVAFDGKADPQHIAGHSRGEMADERVVLDAFAHLGVDQIEAVALVPEQPERTAEVVARREIQQPALDTGIDRQ
ncbi:hypothetical protein D9M71_558630 [compost metagenome]